MLMIHSLPSKGPAAMKKPKQAVSLLLSLLLILFTLPGASLAVPSDSDRAAEEAPVQIELAVGETFFVTMDGTLEIVESSGPDVASAVVRHTTVNVEVPYTATASASREPWSFDGITYSADRVIDGKTDTCYWSDGNQQKDDWVMVVRFDAVRVVSAKGFYCTGAKVQISSDCSTWMDIGTHSGSGTQEKEDIYPVPSTAEHYRYIRVCL